MLTFFYYTLVDRGFIVDIRLTDSGTDQNLYCFLQLRPFLKFYCLDFDYSPSTGPGEHIHELDPATVAVVINCFE
jgi:hypothetical protein